MGVFFGGREICHADVQVAVLGQADRERAPHGLPALDKMPDKGRLRGRPGIRHDRDTLCPAHSEGVRKGRLPEQGIASAGRGEDHVRHKACFLQLFKGVKSLAPSCQHVLHFRGSRSCPCLVGPKTNLAHTGDGEVLSAVAGSKEHYMPALCSEGSSKGCKKAWKGMIDEQYAHSGNSCLAKGMGAASMAAPRVKSILAVGILSNEDGFLLSGLVVYSLQIGLQGKISSFVVVGILLTIDLGPLIHIQSECLLSLIIGIKSNAVVLGQLIHIGQALCIGSRDEDINALHNGTRLRGALPIKQILHGKVRIVADHEVYAGTATDHDIVLVIDHDVVAGATKQRVGASTAIEVVVATQTKEEALFSLPFSPPRP